MSGRRAVLFIAFALVVALTAPGAVASQGRGIEMKEVAKISGGALSGLTGWMARRAGMPDEVETETFLNAAATKKRVDDKTSKSSTIIDLEKELYITLDHDDKTAVVKTFDQIRAEYQAMLDQVSEESEPAEEEKEAAEEAMAPPKMSMSVEPTGRTLKHQGFNAEEFYQTISMESSEPNGGTLVFFSILYMTDEIDLSAMRQFDQAFAEALGEAVYTTGQVQLSVEAMLEAPSMQEMYADAQEANELLGDRVAVYNKTYMVSVPAGKEFERELAMNEKKEEGGGFGGFMKKAAQSAKPLGGGEDEEDEEAEDEQKTSFIFENEYRDFEHKNPNDDKFEVPRNYKVEQS